MRKVLREHNVLESVEVCFSHEDSHVFVNNVDVVFGLHDAIHINIHSNAKAVVDVLSDEGNDQLEQLGGDIILHLADIYPFECCLKCHRLCFWKNQLS